MKTLLILLALGLTSTIFAQSTSGNTSSDVANYKMMDDGYVKGTYSISGGLLGALNLDKLLVYGDNLARERYKFQVGWSAGAWLNLPLSQSWSLEPQVMYSLYKYRAVDGSLLLPNGGLNFISVPLLIKLNPRRDVAFTFGPQLDLLMSLKDTPSSVIKDNFSSASLSLSAGIEFLPHEDVQIFVRAVHGIGNFDNRNLDNNTQYVNFNIQEGVKIKLFGTFTPADTDMDGIPDSQDNCPDVKGLVEFKGCPDTDSDGITDADDLCPAVAGVARYNGCPIPDTDNDGINDEVDKCPKVAGTSKYDGCPIPDTDNDGINDEMDKCPSTPGIAKYNGCPIPDTDGDGINDENDKCPTVKGLAQFSGCPNPDKDKDGVPDVDDQCPDIPGPVNNDGCPVVENAVFNAKQIQFVTGSAQLTAQAKKDIKEGAKLLNSGDFANLKVEIQGHTDNVGSTDSNHKLSHRRADSVKAELVKDGVRADRLTTAGFGEDKPIADNKTKEGRALNRRVVLKARQ